MKTAERIRLPERLPSRPAVNKQASVLIISLWFIALLTIFAVYLGYGVRQKLALAYRLDQRERLRFIADAGIKKAIVAITREDLDSFAALSDTWSSDPLAFKDIPVSDGYFSVSYDHLDETSGTVYIRYGLTDEEAKININTADQKILRRLFRTVLRFNETKAAELAASIVDWRDGDSALSIPIGSAEDSDYRRQAYSYEAKDAAFEVLEELLLVNGMDSDILEKIRDYITLYGDGKVNVNTASRTALVALGLDAPTADKILRYRNGEDETFGTFDDIAFSSHAAIIPQLSQFVPVSDAEVAQLSRVVDQNLAVTSHHFTVRSAARLKNEKLTATIISTIDEKGKILSWHES